MHSRASTVEEGVNFGSGWGKEGGNQDNIEGITCTRRGRRGPRLQREVT
jgi:hypothetical protein